MITYYLRQLMTHLGRGMERYRSGHNEAVLKTVCPKGRVGSNPTLSVIDSLDRHIFSYGKLIFDRHILFGEVPKLAEGTPLERVQVVNSGARVQIPPSPFITAGFAKTVFGSGKR